MIRNLWSHTLCNMSTDKHQKESWKQTDLDCQFYSKSPPQDRVNDKRYEDEILQFTVLPTSGRSETLSGPSRCGELYFSWPRASTLQRKFLAFALFGSLVPRLDEACSGKVPQVIHTASFGVDCTRTTHARLTASNTNHHLSYIAEETKDERGVF